MDSFETVNDLMNEGLANRTTHGTKMNAQSSRSHSVFTIEIIQQLSVAGEAGKPLTEAGTKSAGDLFSLCVLFLSL